MMNWEVKTLNQLSENLDSKRVPITKNRRTKGTIPYYGASGIVDYIKDYLFDEDLLLVSEDGANLLARTYPIAFSISGKTWVNNHAHVLKFSNSITQKFVEIYLNSISLDDFVSGMAQPKLNQAMLNKIPIPLPPLPEQKRIVAILDEAFATIDKAKANAEQNLKNAKELFESYLQGVFEKKGEGWVKDTLETLLEKGWVISHLDGNHGGDYPKREEFKNEGVPYISANCLKETNIDFSLAKHLSPEKAATFRKGVAINNDVLFAHNATVGPVAILKTEKEKVILGTSLTYYRCNTEYILPEYLANYMRSKEFKQQYEIIMRQSTRNQVPITKQREFYHIIPPIDFQHQIVINLEQLLEQSQKLKSIYQQKLNVLEDLKKSILQKAFAGEL